MHLQQGTLLQGGKYKIVRFISAGGFGCTYEGVHVMLKKRVAIKEFFVKDFCNRDEATASVTIGITSKTALVNKLKDKFIEEAQYVSTLKHPHIVNATDVFTENGTAYYVMDFIDGTSLNDMVMRDGALSEQKALKYILQVADALKYVHSQNRLHLDIKPGNIMVDGKDNAMLTDFGTSKQYDEVNGENTSTITGQTPGYAPSEQMGNDIVKFYPSTDIYSLGATLYKLLTGVTPPSASLLASGEELDPLPSSISENVRNAVYKAMQINKKKRPQSMEEFVKMLTLSGVDGGGEETILDGKTRKMEESYEERIRRIAYEKFQEESLSEAKEAERLAIEKEIERLKKEKEESERRKEEERKRIEQGLRGYVQGNTIKYVVNGVEFTMIKVKGGTFDMKETKSVSCGFLGLSTKKVDIIQTTTLSDYFIGEAQVTQALWEAVLGSNPSYFKGDNLPVENVSWNDCQTFISKLNSLTGKSFRLPTEAEWEYAARGGNKSKDFIYSGSNNPDDVAWYWKNSGDEYLNGSDDDWDLDKIEKNNCKTHPVATKQSNELGIYDMSGNVWEWCQDWKGYYSSSSQTNPTGPNSGSGRVDRGGSWCGSARGCRSSCRSNDAPDGRHDCLGLRLVLSE